MPTLLGHLLLKQDPVTGNGHRPQRARRAPTTSARRAATPNVVPGVHEARRAHIKAAVFISEKELFERACHLEGGTPSHLIREYLIELARKHGLVSP